LYKKIKIHIEKKSVSGIIIEIQISLTKRISDEYKKYRYTLFLIIVVNNNLYGLLKRTTNDVTVLNKKYTTQSLNLTQERIYLLEFENVMMRLFTEGGATVGAIAGGAHGIFSLKSLKGLKGAGKGAIAGFSIGYLMGKRILRKDYNDFLNEQLAKLDQQAEKEAV
jgi:hypothetical protein